MLIGNNHQIGWPKNNVRPLGSANVSSVWAIEVVASFMCSQSPMLWSPQRVVISHAMRLFLICFWIWNTGYTAECSSDSQQNLWGMHEKHVCIPAYLPLKVSSWLLSSLPLWRPPTIFLLCSTGSSVMILKWQCFPIASPYAQFPTLIDGPTGLTGYLSKVITMMSWKHRPTFYTLKKSHSSSSSLSYNHHITLSCIYPQS